MSHGICPGCFQPESECTCGDVKQAFIESQVKHPSHYIAYPIEVIDIIQLVLDEIDARGIDISSFQASCLKDEIKYRFRAGLKGDTDEDIIRDIRKALTYMDFRDGGK